VTAKAERAAFVLLVLCVQVLYSIPGADITNNPSLLATFVLNLIFIFGLLVSNLRQPGPEQQQQQQQQQQHRLGGESLAVTGHEQQQQQGCALPRSAETRARAMLRLLGFPATEGYMHCSCLHVLATSTL
jgi:hypothetical protein